MGRAIAVANQKGGVGKTTTCVNLSFTLALMDKKVLLCDIDPQGNSTSSLSAMSARADGMGGAHPPTTATSYEVLIDPASINDAIVKTSQEGLELIPASSELLGMEKRLATVGRPLLHLRRALEPIRSFYDFIFIDCPPSLGLLPLNAMAAADTVLIPVQAEFLPMEGLSQIVRAIEEIKTTVNPLLDIEGVLITMFDYTEGLAREVEAEVRKFFGDKTFKTKIPRDELIASAPSFGKPALENSIRSLGARSYIKLAKEIINGPR